MAAHVGPGRIDQRVVVHGGYRLAVSIGPNQAAVPNDFVLRLTRDGKPAAGADVTLQFTMLDMEMGQLTYTMPEGPPGTYRRSAPALVMVGHWGVDFQVAPKGDAPFSVLLVDKAAG